MEAKIVLVFCVQAIVIQIISSQCINNVYDNLAWSNGANNLAWSNGANNLAWEASCSPYSSYNAPYAAPSWPSAPQATSYATADWASNYGPLNLAASNGGGLPVSSSSQIPPSGVYLASENAYSGPLAVSGAMPFLGTVGLEGALPTAGAGAVSYGCGNGNVAMMSENMSGYNAYSNYGYAPSTPEYAYSYASPASEYGYSFAPSVAEYGYGYPSTSGCSSAMAIDAALANTAYGYNYRY